MAGIAVASWLWLFALLFGPLVERILARMEDPQAPPPIQFSLQTMMAVMFCLGIVMTLASVPMPVRALDFVCFAVLLLLVHALPLLLFSKQRNTVRDVAAQRLRFRKKHVQQ
jgi:hypothetical protein